MHKLQGKRVLITAGPLGIRVNALAPGLILGPSFHHEAIKVDWS
jgi:NAD(P)-dependent dehydrogenase (short-subunit alcohol dehydrogenase family)